MNRASGVLLPVFSLPSKYGIGCISKEAYQFVDQLEKRVRVTGRFCHSDQLVTGIHHTSPFLHMLGTHILSIWRR